VNRERQEQPGRQGHQANKVRLVPLARLDRPVQLVRRVNLE
jgi:hypothetical protein